MPYTAVPEIIRCKK